MIGQLTKPERQLALVILCVVAVLGLLMMVAGRNDPLGGEPSAVATANPRAELGGTMSDDPGRSGGDRAGPNRYDGPAPGAGVAEARVRVRRRIEPLGSDREPGPDLAAATDLVRSGALADLVSAQAKA